MKQRSDLVAAETQEARYRLLLTLEKQRRQKARRHEAIQWLIALVAFFFTILWLGGWFGGGNVFDKQPLGGRRSSAQEEAER